MRVPVPKNRLVAFTLAGAVLTAVVAGGLAFPIPGVTQSGGPGDGSGDPASAETPQAVADAPTPNGEFTPAVQTRSGHEREEHEAYEEERDREEEEHDEGGEE